MHKSDINKFVLLFPGQGSQKVGMGLDLYEQRPRARQIFNEANDVLGFSLTNKMFLGPKEDLQKTIWAQPAILAHSVAVWECLKEDGLADPALLAGHSLGEYSALVAASSLTFADAIKAVHLRGKFMQEAVPENEGAMAVVLGMPAEEIQKLCTEISSSSHNNYVAVANLNGPEQTVISGTMNGISLAESQLKLAGAKRILPLPVSAPFHCALMSPAQIKLSVYLDEINFTNAKIPVVSNVTALPVTDGKTIKENLKKQVTAPVLFTQTVEYFKNKNMNIFIEAGSGKTLVGIVKRMMPDVKLANVENVETLNTVNNLFL